MTQQATTTTIPAGDDGGKVFFPLPAGGAAARKKNKKKQEYDEDDGEEEEEEEDALQLGDTIRASVPGLPMLDGAELVVIRLDRTGAGSLTLLVTDKRDRVRYGYRHQLSAAEFAALFRDTELLERATERGFARQNGLVPGKWIRLRFQDGTSVRGEIVELVEDMIVVESGEGGASKDNEDEDNNEDEDEDEEGGRREMMSQPQQQQLFIDFAYRGVPPEIVSLALVDPPFRTAATAASTAFEPEPLDQIQQLVEEAEQDWERERREEDAVFGDDDDADFAADAASSAAAGGFDTYTIAVQVDVLVTAMLSRYADAQRTPALLLRVQSAVQRYCHARRTAMAHEGERALHWIVPPPCPATAFTEQQTPIGADTYGQRGRSTRAQPLPAMPRWLLPVVAAQSAVCVSPDQLEAAAAAAPPDTTPLSLALDMEAMNTTVRELERSDNADGRRSGRVHSETLRLWRNVYPPAPGGDIGTVPEIRSRGGVHAIVSNYDLAAFEHTSGAWDEDLARRVRPAKKQQKKRGKKKAAAATKTSTNKNKRKKIATTTTTTAFDSEADEASGASSGAETEVVVSGDEDESILPRQMGRSFDTDSIDFGSSSEDESVAGGARDDYEPDSAAAAAGSDEEEMEEEEEEEEMEKIEEPDMVDGEAMPVSFVRRQTTTLVRLMPPLVAVTARQFTDRDHPDFSTLPSSERGYALISGDAAAVRSMLCVPPTAVSSARSSLFERIAATEVAVPLTEYVEYMRGRPATDVSRLSWWQQQQQQRKRKRGIIGLVHATLDPSDPEVAALDDRARLEMMVQRIAPTGSDLLSSMIVRGATSLDRILHLLAPASAALRGPGDAALLRQVLARAQRNVRHATERRARQARVVANARYTDEWKTPAGSAAETLVSTLLFSMAPQRQRRQQQEEKEKEEGGEDTTTKLTPAQQLMLDHLESEYLPAGRRGSFSGSGQQQQRLAAVLASEQLLGWLRQDGGAALSALVAHATDHLAPNVPLLLERGARPQPLGGEQCGPRVLAKTYSSTAEMLADAAPVFDADLDPVDYALAQRLKEAHAKEMGRRSPSASQSPNPGLYDYILADIERTQAYGPGVDYPRYARSMVVRKHAVVPGNYAVVRSTEEAGSRAFYVRRQPEQGGPAVWVRDPEVQSDAAFMTTEAMLCEIRSLRAPTGRRESNLGPDAFCLATTAAAAEGKTPKQCVSGLALVEQKRTALLDEIARRQRAVHRVSLNMWLARARHRGKRVAPPSGMQQMLTGDRAMSAQAGRVAERLGMTVVSTTTAAATGEAIRRAEDSPHFPLWRRIDGGEYELGPEARFDAIAKFAHAVCRDPISGIGESPHWLVCKDSGAPLVPVVLRDLAAAFLAGRGCYDALLARLLNEAEDTGDAYVHGPTGTVLRLVESAAEYRFDEDGMAVADRTQEMRETQAARGVAQRLGGAAAAAAGVGAAMGDVVAESELTAMAQSADGQFLHRYVMLLTQHLGAGTGPRLRRAALQMALDMVAHPRVVPNKKTYDASVAKLAKQQQKPARAPLEYDALVRQRKIAAAAAAVLVAVQTTTTTGVVVARDAFRGCVATFTGFPLDPDARQREAIDYVACVLSSVSRDDAGARGLFATPRETALQIERAVLGVALVDIPSVQRALDEKRQQQKQQKQQRQGNSNRLMMPVVRDDDAFFVPPLRPAPPAMLGSSTGSVRMRRLAMALVHTLRRQLSRQQLLLLTRKAQLPILSNACCETRRVSALLDYAQRDPEVRQILREMFATAAAPQTIMTAACGAALRSIPRGRPALLKRSRLVAKLGPLDRVRAFLRASSQGELKNDAVTASFARLPADQTTLAAPSLMAIKLGAKETGPAVDRDGRPLDAPTLDVLQKAVEIASEDQTQTLLVANFRQTLLPPNLAAANTTTAADTTTTTASSSSSSSFAVPSELPRAAASMLRMRAVSAAADRFEARTAASAGQATRDLRDALQGALVAQLGMLQAFLKAFCSAREPRISLTAADYGSAAKIGAYTDYATLMRLGGAWFARSVLDEMAAGGQQTQQTAREFSFQRPVATVMNRAIEAGYAGGAGLGAETGAAQILDFYSEVANAWGCVYARRAMHHQQAASDMVPAPHKHWGLDEDDYTYLLARTDLPFQNLEQNGEGKGRHIVAFAAMQGVGSSSSGGGTTAAETRMMWTTAINHYLHSGFRAQADAFRRRATAWIPSAVTSTPTSSDASAHELAQMGCLCTLLHVCLLFADASGAPKDNSAVAASARPRIVQMAQYLSRLPTTLRTGEQPSRAEPAATTYSQIAERIAFSNDREKEAIKQRGRLMANDRAAAMIDRQLKALGIGKIDAKRLNKYGARNRQGFISHDLNERSTGDGTNAYDSAMHQQQQQRDGGDDDEDGDAAGDDEYNDGDEEMEDFGDIDEYGREHD